MDGTDVTPLLRIGPFSRASSLSIKTLRAYHEAGLLVPADVDPRTGYRSYSLDQLTDATVIRRLRELDVPLDAIREVLDSRDPSATRKVLAEHQAVLERRLAATQRAIDDLYATIGSPALHTPVHVRQEPARVVLTVTGTVTLAEWEGFLVHARGLLVDAAAASGAVIDGAFGGCYPTLVDDDAQDVVVFLPVVDPPLLSLSGRASGVRVGELPAVAVAVMAHRGDYDALPDVYRHLGSWVAAHALPADLPVREVYLIGPAETEDPSEYQTEIYWPVRAS